MPAEPHCDMPHEDMAVRTPLAHGPEAIHMGVPAWDALSPEARRAFLAAIRGARGGRR